MFRVKWVGLFALPVALTAVLGLLAIPSSSAIDEATARLVGLSLLGIALLSTILVFYAAAKTPAPAPRQAVVPAGRAGNEFRRGFAPAGAAPAARPQRVAVARPNDVIALRRRHLEPRVVPSKPPAPVAVMLVPAAAPATIASLKRRLEDRAEQLWPRRAG